MAVAALLTLFMTSWEAERKFLQKTRTRKLGTRRNMTKLMGL